MGDIWFRLILGHLVGDYLLQNNWMALNKKKRFDAAIIHCNIYTMAIFGCLNLHVQSFWWGVLIYASIFLSHFVFDKFDIVEWWLEKIGGRSYKSVGRYMQKSEPEIYKQFYVAYTAIVQTMADNTLHLITMYCIIKLILKV